MKSNHISGIWVKQDTPSNLQFIAAHLIFEIQQHFQGIVYAFNDYNKK